MVSCPTITVSIGSIRNPIRSGRPDAIEANCRARPRLTQAALLDPGPVLGVRCRSGDGPIERPQITLGVLIVAGGTAILASYLYAFALSPALRTGLWGGVPASLQPLYTVSMLTAAAGFFPFTFLLVFRVDPASFRFAGSGYGLLHVLYAIVLVPSALWLPLTARMLEAPDALVWAEIRSVLALVGLGSVGLVAVCVAIARERGGALAWAAVAGTLAFTFQTAVLDALVWPYYFPFTP